VGYWDHPTFGPEVEIQDRDCGWKYNVSIARRPAVVARELRQIADWLERLDER
jgi:hypothetical protein